MICAAIRPDASDVRDPSTIEDLVPVEAVHEGAKGIGQGRRGHLFQKPRQMRQDGPCLAGAGTGPGATGADRRSVTIGRPARRRAAAAARHSRRPPRSAPQPHRRTGSAYWNRKGSVTWLCSWLAEQYGQPWTAGRRCQSPAVEHPRPGHWRRFRSRCALPGGRLIPRRGGC